MLEIYQVIFSKLDAKTGKTRKEIAAEYFAHFHKLLSGKRLEEVLKLLTGVGLLHEEPDPDDKRRMKFYNAMEKINTPLVGGNDNGSPPSAGVFNLDDLVSVGWTEDFGEKTCGVCGHAKPTAWQAKTNKHETIAICEDCVRIFQTKRERATS